MLHTADCTQRGYLYESRAISRSRYFNRQPATGNRQQATGNRQPASDSLAWFSVWAGFRLQRTEQGPRNLHGVVPALPQTRLPPHRHLGPCIAEPTVGIRDRQAPWSSKVFASLCAHMPIATALHTQVGPRSRPCAHIHSNPQGVVHKRCRQVTSRHLFRD